MISQSKNLGIFTVNIVVLKYHQTLELFYLSFGPIQGVSFLPHEMAPGKTRHIYLYNNIKGWKKKTLAFCSYLLFPLTCFLLFFCSYLRSKKELFKKSLHHSADNTLRLTDQNHVTSPLLNQSPEREQDHHNWLGLIELHS